MAPISKSLALGALLATSSALPAPLNARDKVVVWETVTDVVWTTIDITTTITASGAHPTGTTMTIGPVDAHPTTEVRTVTVAEMTSTPTATPAAPTVAADPSPSPKPAQSVQEHQHQNQNQAPAASTTTAAPAPTVAADPSPSPKPAQFVQEHQHQNQNQAPAAPTTTAAPAPAPAPSPKDPQPDPSPSPAPAPAPAQSSSSGNSSPSPNPGTGGSSSGYSGPCSESSPCSGQVTFYDTATSPSAPSACGTTNNGHAEDVLALPVGIMGPSDCGKTVTVQYGGSTVTGTVVDKCMGCDDSSIDLSRHFFGSLADFAEGRLHGVTWWIN